MNEHRKLVLDKEKILSQVERLAQIAREQKWVYEYDADLDELVLGSDYMPRDSFLFNVNEEINLFISPDSSVNGIHIEYFQANFLEHNKELKPVLGALKKKKKSEKGEEVKTALELELVADTFKSLLSKDKLVTAI